MQALNLFFVPAVLLSGAILGSLTSAAIVAGGLWSVAQLMRPSLFYKRNSAALLIAAALASLPLAELVSSLINGTSLKKLAEDVPLLFFLPLFSVFFAPRQRLRHHFEIVAIAFSFLSAAIAIVQVEFYSARAGGAGNAGVFAVMVVILFSFNVLAFLRRDDRGKWLAGLAAMGSATALVLSGMRSLWPLLFIIPPTLAFFYGKANAFRLPRRAVFVLLPCLVAAGVVMFEPVQQRLHEGMHDIENLNKNNYETSLGQRIVLWKAARQLIAERPWFGFGPAGARQKMIETTNAIDGRPLFFSHFHNALLTYWVRSGVFGAFSLLLILGVPLVALRRHVHDETGRHAYAFLITLQAIYFASGLFGVMFGQDLMDTVYVGLLSVVAYLVLGEEAQQSPEKPASPEVETCALPRF